MNSQEKLSILLDNILFYFSLGHFKMEVEQPTFKKELKKVGVKDGEFFSSLRKYGIVTVITNTKVQFFKSEEGS